LQVLCYRERTLSRRCDYQALGKGRDAARDAWSSWWLWATKCADVPDVVAPSGLSADGDVPDRVPLLTSTSARQLSRESGAAPGVDVKLKAPT
jgi:hypothetical protein